MTSREPANSLQLRLPAAGRAARALVLLVALLLVLSMVGQYAKHVYGHTQLKGFVPLFYVDFESNVPTWYSSLALAVAGGLAGLIAAAAISRRQRFGWHWASLAALLAGLSLDEIAMIHEMPIDALRDSMQAGGVLYYTWVIPGAILVVLVGLAFLPFWLHLPGRTRLLIFLSAGLFVGGAIGVEMLSGAWADRYGEENLMYSLIITVEETCEMLGVVVLIGALLDYVHRSVGPVYLHVPLAAPRKSPASQ